MRVRFQISPEKLTFDLLFDYLNFFCRFNRYIRKQSTRYIKKIFV